jgi:DNA polymerase-3 subunit delta'
MQFSRILGQEKAKGFLRQVMAMKKMPHAYLFTGIPGIGKTSTATALANALNCQEPVDGDSCGNCVVCRQMRDGNFPDLLKVSPDGQNIKIEQIRELNRSLNFAPVSGRYRVSIIYKAGTMTDEAANSFLKTLEEPPPANILILNATEPLDLLQTIVSRCQKVPFQPLPVKDMTMWLVREKGLDEEIAMVLSKISGGSLGRALKMCAGDFLEKRRGWLSMLTKVPRLPREKTLDAALECAKEDKKREFDVSETGEAGIMEMLYVWESWYRDLIVVKVEGPSGLLINTDYSHELQNVAGSFKIKCLVGSLIMIDQSQRDLQRMRNTSLVLQHCILGLHRLAGVG